MEDIKTEEFVPEMTAGEMLRNARTTGRRKREISTVAKQLCIREEFLQALEDGNYTFIPELVYILGFARNYAMELGLDPDEIVAKIKHELGVVPEFAISDDDDNKKQKKTEMLLDMWKNSLAFAKKYWIWLTAAFVGLVVVCVVVAFVVSGTETAESDAPDTAVVAVETVAEPVFSVAVHERFGAENSKKAKIILQALRDNVWIKIEDARSRTEFSRVLSKGDIYYVPADGKFQATFGDAGAIDVWVDGKLAPKTGADHERKTDIQLTADKLMSRSGGE